MPGADLVRTTYTDLRDLLAAVDETDSWSPTGARGWCVRDLTYHCTMDAQRALVALHEDDSGAMSVEKILILALIALPIIIVLLLFKDTIKSWFKGQSDQLKPDNGP